MLRYRIARFLLSIGVPALVLAGCAPIRPVTHDTLGRELPIVNAAVSAVVPVGFPGTFTMPLDAAPDPDATQIYIAGEGPKGPGLFQVAWDGGDVMPIVVGEPFADPMGVAVSLDGKTIYVADNKTALGQGAILAVDAVSKAVSTVAGTPGTAPRGLEVANVDGTDYIYYTGAERDTGSPALYRIPATGADSAELLASGAPFVEPIGVAVGDGGTLYVADRLAGAGDTGAAFKVADGKAEKLAEGFRTGDRVVGATLTQDGKVLLVSAMASDMRGAQVIGVDLTSGTVFAITKEVAQHPGSGGVHRAHNANVFSWADSGISKRKGGADVCNPCVMRIETP